MHRSVAQADSSFYGLGEHKDNKLERSQNGGYKKLFADSIFYGKSQGGVVIFIFYFRLRLDFDPFTRMFSQLCIALHTPCGAFYRAPTYHCGSGADWRAQSDGIPGSRGPTQSRMCQSRGIPPRQATGLFGTPPRWARSRLITTTLSGSPTRPNVRGTAGSCHGNRRLLPAVVPRPRPAADPRSRIRSLDKKMTHGSQAGSYCRVCDFAVGLHVATDRSVWRLSERRGLTV